MNADGLWFYRGSRYDGTKPPPREVRPRTTQDHGMVHDIDDKEQMTERSTTSSTVGYGRVCDWYREGIVHVQVQVSTIEILARGCRHAPEALSRGIWRCEKCTVRTIMDLFNEPDAIARYIPRVYCVRGGAQEHDRNGRVHGPRNGVGWRDSLCFSDPLSIQRPLTTNYLLQVT